MPPMEDQAYNPGSFPDQESNKQHWCKELRQNKLSHTSQSDLDF